MKDIWRNRYVEMAERPGIGDFQVLTGFNANIDRTIELEELDWSLDVDGTRLESVENVEDVKKVLKYSIENGKNLEVDASKLNKAFELGETSIGGQAGIMANFLSGLNGSVTFYTPLLSDELAEMIDERVLNPCFEEEFILKNVRDSSNTDRTKENVIIEFSEPKSGRLILSDRLRGFGPYFRSGIEDNLELIDENIQGALFSGFQNVTGNKQSKIEKSRQQLEKIESRTHIELVDCSRDLFHLIGNKLLPHVESIGLDENEALQLAEVAGKDISAPLHIGEAFDLFKTLIEETELQRCHLHTYRYHIVVAKEDYNIRLDDIRDGMLFGELSAIKSAEIGRIPELNDFDGISFEDIHVKSLDEFEEFEDFFDLEDFAKTGLARIEGFKIAGVPTLIHEDPERLVGMGDLISSGAFAYELSRET